MWSAQAFKGCLPQILLGPFLNTLTHVKVACAVDLSHSNYLNQKACMDAKSGTKYITNFNTLLILEFKYYNKKNLNQTKFIKQKQKHQPKNNYVWFKNP